VTRVALLAVVAALGCEPAPPPPPALPAMSLDRPVVADSGLPPGRCPQDAPWNGKVCFGQGYAACPGDHRLDDAGACERLARDAGADR
jgi:hypothetical protein